MVTGRGIKASEMKTNQGEEQAKTQVIPVGKVNEEFSKPKGKRSLQS